MIEAYAFLAMFSAQIAAGSILFPARLVRYARGWATNFGSQNFAQRYPGVDYQRAIERFVMGYRAVSIAIASLGLLLLGWLFTLVQQPDWEHAASKAVLLYFLAQMSPMVLVALYAVVRHHKLLLQPSQEARRKATLKRRGLFDYVSPWVVLLAALSYVAFVGIAVYLDLRAHQDAFLSRQCLIAIGSVTLVYAMNGFVIYKYLYGRRNPLVTNEGRSHTIGVRVKGAVYSSIAVTWFIAVMGAMARQELYGWKPFALSLFLSITLLLSFLDVTAPPRIPGADTPDSGAADGDELASNAPR